jgi:hypothetical protein
LIIGVVIVELLKKRSDLALYSFGRSFDEGDECKKLILIEFVVVIIIDFVFVIFLF